MSEGPEVRRTADRLEEALVGKVVEAVEYRRRSGGLAPEIAKRLIGARVKRVRTFGKHLVIDFTRGVFLHNHMMMFGKWRNYDREAFDAGEAKPPPRSRIALRRALPPGVTRGPTVEDVRDDSRVRLVLVAAETVAIEFNGPLLAFSTTDPAEGSAIERLGPDALATRFDTRAARARLRKRAHLKLADLLLDQTFVAGIGNKYKADILWKLGLDPFMRAGDLTAVEITELLREIPRMLRYGYEHAGRTRPLEEGESAGSWALRHIVFRRSGQACWRCGDKIKSDRKRSARVTFYCPTCQPERPTTAMKLGPRADGKAPARARDKTKRLSSPPRTSAKAPPRRSADAPRGRRSANRSPRPGP